MNLLFLDLHCDALLPAGVGEFGGGNTYSRSILNLISKFKDINCLYITRKKSEDLTEELDVSGNIQFIRIKIGEYGLNDKDTLFLYTESTAEKILKILKQKNYEPDIIHSSYWPSGLVSLKINSIFHAKQYHTVLSNGKRKKIESGHYEIEKQRITSETKIYQHVDKIICSSKAEYEDINTLYGIKKDKLILTGLDVDDSYRYPTYFKDGSFLTNNFYGVYEKKYIKLPSTYQSDISKWWNDGAFLYFGRLHVDKGVIQIIDAWLELFESYEDFPAMWIAGGSPEQIFEIRTLIKHQSSLNIAEKQGKLLWWGRLSYEGISTLLLKCLCVVTHSRYEAGGLMILESLSAGKPIIATPNGFAKDCIKNWYNGFLVQFNDKELLKLRMTHFYHQPLLSSELCQNSVNSFEKIDELYGFRKKHLSLYGITPPKEKIEQNFARRLPYPLSEHLPSDVEILKIFEHCVLENDLFSTGQAIVLKKKEIDACIIWRISLKEKQYFGIRWKNHINVMKTFCSAMPFFYSASLQYNNNKKFLLTNNIENTYVDDDNKIIFVEANKHELKKAKFSHFNKASYLIPSRTNSWTMEDALLEIEDLLQNYPCVFAPCHDLIVKIVHKIESIERSSTISTFCPKDSARAYVLGKKIVFINDYFNADKGYLNAIIKQDACTQDISLNPWELLLKCKKAMLEALYLGYLDTSIFSKIYTLLE